MSYSLYNLNKTIWKVIRQFIGSRSDKWHLCPSEHFVIFLVVVDQILDVDLEPLKFNLIYCNSGNIPNITLSFQA